jgi:hypothetical protein
VLDRVPKGLAGGLGAQPQSSSSKPGNMAMKDSAGLEAGGGSRYQLGTLFLAAGTKAQAADEHISRTFATADVVVNDPSSMDVSCVEIQ